MFTRPGKYLQSWLVNGWKWLGLIPLRDSGWTGGFGAAKVGFRLALLRMALSDFFWICWGFRRNVLMYGL
jgi:hypothetical protein